MSFKKNKYSILRGVISKELANFTYAYFINKRKVARFLFDHKWLSPFTEYYGVWNDHQAPNTYSHYGDLVMETLLQRVKPVMEKHTKLKLSETYSYARIYKKGDILHRHKDRPSCEISTTINLGGIKVDLKPGDMLIYSGCTLEHWREEFTGNNCGQVFLHYNKAGTKNARENQFDKRPFLGLPTFYKGFKIK